MGVSRESNSDLFALDEPPTFPGRTRSGGSIKVGVVRAMYEQHQAVKIAHRSADRLLRVLVEFSAQRR